jgi:hypothetical protein
VSAERRRIWERREWGVCALTEVLDSRLTDERSLRRGDQLIILGSHNGDLVPGLDDGAIGERLHGSAPVDQVGAGLAAHGVEDGVDELVGQAASEVG